MYSSLLLTLLQFTAAVSLGNKLTWCEYWQRRGIDRTECLPAKMQHWSLESANLNNQPPTPTSVPICDVVTDWSRCQNSDHCPLGLLCWRHGTACCTPQLRSITPLGSQQCPVPHTLGIQCNVRNPVNWCHSDNDCLMQKCCPSGCGYNICLRTGPSQNLRMRIATMSIVPDMCPPMDSIDVVCISNGISWCNSSGQCLQNGVQKRSCCPTRCGYNVCLLQLSPTKWIIS